MFKLFKKSAENNVEVAETKTEAVSQTVSKYSQEVMQIHHEFETAAENLLISAKEVIKEAESKDTLKASRLESLGFKQAAQVTELNPLIQKAALSQEQLQLLSYYQANYPLNKFITEEQVKAICYKYNLVCGPVKRFKGFVPEKNLKEIEAFKLKKKDELGNIVVFYEDSGKIEKFNPDRYIASNKNYVLNTYIIKHAYAYVSSPRDRNYIGDTSNYTKIINTDLHFDRSFRDQYENQVCLQICAPVKDMDISGLELVEGYKLQKKHIPDPVVLQPVKGGFLILTAWGDEASDEMVVNQKLN